VVDARLQVLVEQSLELLVLLVEQSCLFDQVLAFHQQSIVLRQRFVQGSPQSMTLIRENLRHALPKHLLLSLLSLQLLLLSLEVGLLLQSWVYQQVLRVQLFFSLLVEFLQHFHNIIQVHVWLGWVFLLLVRVRVFLLLHNWVLRVILGIFGIFAVLGIFRVWSNRGIVVALLVLLHSKSFLLFFLESLSLLWPKLVECVDKQLYIIH